MTGDHAPAPDDIAVIGLGCRFPGADGPETFWELLANGIDAVTEIPPARWDVDAYYDRDAGVPGKMNTRAGGFLSGIEMFDPGFFGLSPRAASFMDPQQRLLLEVVWEAFEHAGIASDRMAGANCATFVGISQSDYGRLVSGDIDDINAYSLTGNALSVTVNRLSYFFDLHGPSMAVDTACSSSLVAVHLACQSLRTGESDLAIAAGCNLILSPQVTVAVSQLWLTSAQGRCRSFAADADGYVRSEGCGVVVLKRLTDAQRDGDRILALLCGSAVNQNGRGSGITAPGVTAQTQVITRALRRTAIDPDEIDFVEAHGAGSKANDDLELEALHRAFGSRARSRPCLLGSVKTNIGSLEPASGIAGLIKVILALQHGAIPPNLPVGPLNPRIDAGGTFRIPAELEDWPAGQGPRRAGVHSYGIGGTNAHVVVQEAAPGPTPAPPEPGACYPLLLSARTPTALQEMARRLVRHLDAHPEDSVEATCSTLAYGRARFPYRLAAVVASRSDSTTLLTAWLTGDVPTTLVTGHASADLPSMREDIEQVTLLERALQWVQGNEVLWPELGAHSRERATLATYPFERVRCWYTD